MKFAPSTNPMNYKTERGLKNAIAKACKTYPGNMKLSWWLKNAEWTLINQWGWPEENAAYFTNVAHKQQGSIYKRVS